MPNATLKEAVSTNSAPPYIIAKWECSDSTSLIEISLPGFINSNEAYKKVPNDIKTETAYAIRISSFGISCGSTNFDVQVLARNDETLVDSNYEVLSYSSVNLSFLDQTFNNFIIKNCDISMTNKLYILLTNNSGLTGTINIQMVYEVIQDRMFTNIISS